MFARGALIAYHYGRWGLEFHLGQEIKRDNFKIPHRLFNNIVLLTEDYGPMKWVNDAKGTGCEHNVLVYSAIKAGDTHAKVREFVQGGGVSKLRQCGASGDIYAWARL